MFEARSATVGASSLNSVQLLLGWYRDGPEPPLDNGAMIPMASLRAQRVFQQWSASFDQRPGSGHLF